MTEETKITEEITASEEVTATEETNVEAAQEEQAPEAAATEATPEVPAAAAPVAVEAESVNQADHLDVAVIKKGVTVKGKIVKIDADQAFVDIGYKYDGTITLRELSSVTLENAADAVTLGQEVELKVVSINDAKEQLILSKRVVDSEKAWTELQAKLESKEIFEAVVAEVVKGGLVVDVGLRAFVPASMVERHFVEDFTDYKGRTLKLRVKELDQEKNKVILSQKDVLDEEFEVNKKSVMEGLKIGQELEGTVQRLTPFGAFVNIGGIDGLVHISEMSWQHIDHPNEVVSEGDQVKVQVLKLDPQNDRISLSLKATQPGPWQKLGSELQVGSIVTGKVQRITNFGAFVEVAPGIEGLVHISQVAHRHIATPHEVLKEGQEVQVKILDINPSDKRISLSIKDTEEAPAGSEKQEKPRSDSRGDRPERSRQPKSDYVQQENQKLTSTLGELFGDKLSKFK
ncbi:30S ribosomal protein S1 [Paenibacillus psychroresistens]|uniref:30S ribosomal protein S1 n=1 Tax=Paenibacillus psychroresistens TaxID=1778678 RepID=A0A6B8RMY7_9BACL|nr:30S ribosomal protein S1 [Paenibacillus psychroresistens]QGQ96903.1 30S ribosomal protein S1 [Paenibacillus psychroresistens]